METPLKHSVLDTLKKLEASEDFLSPGVKNPANCNDETAILEIPLTPLLRTLGLGTGVKVMCIKRNHPQNSVRSPWAIKMLSGRANPADKQLYDNRLLEEAKLLRTLSHPNIVGYRAFDALEAGRNFLALEYCTTSLGNILEERYEKNEGPLEANKTMRMSLHVLRGLNYLHTEAHILHGDLKSFNVLINKDFESAKICDFGVSLPLNAEGLLDMEKNPNGRYIGTGIWSAPEVLENNQTMVSNKADMFSFGLVIYETLTLLPPHTFPGIKDESIVTSAGYALLRENVNKSFAKRRLDMSVIEIPDDSDDETEDNDIDEQPIKRKLDDCLDEMRKKLKASETSSVDANFSLDEDDDSDIIMMSDSRYAEPIAEEASAAEADVEPGAAPDAESVTTPGDPNAGAVPTSVAPEAEPSVTPAAPKVEPSATLAASEGEPAVPTAGSTAPKGPFAESVGSDKAEPDSSTDEKPKPAVMLRTIVIDDDSPPRLEHPVARGNVCGEVITIESSNSSSDDFTDDSEDDEFDYDDEDEDDYDEGGYELGESEEEDDDGPYLNYGVLGSRPLIPLNIILSSEHLPLVEMFHVCTNALPQERPDAFSMLTALNKLMENDGEKLVETVASSDGTDVKEVQVTKCTNTSTQNNEGEKDGSANTTPPSE